MPKSKIAILLLFLTLLFAAILFQAGNQYDQGRIRVVVPPGSSTYSVQQILEKNEIIKPNSSFSIVARILGMAKGIQAGEYKFSPNEPLITVLWRLKKGDVLPPEEIRVTFPEGASIYKMGEILAKEEVSWAKNFKNLTDRGITADLRERHWGIFKYIPSESLEGYLYPDTYSFFPDAPMSAVVEVMLNRFEEVVVPFWQKSEKETKMTLHEIITLASIIEKEAQRPEERAIISSVYTNRLRIRMHLGADPTIKYALERPTKRVFLNQLNIDSPYNTYRRYGLPPGPICNPGIESIKAAVYPAKTDYLYFVARKDGSHVFSRTNEEHLKARERVQEKR